MASQRQPVLFIGHGSPMNAIADNDFTRTLVALGRAIPPPRAVLCVSAHWLTEGTWITHMPAPRTIHDFYGFPEELSRIRYGAPGSPQIAEQIRGCVDSPRINLDDERWGLDHGTWAVLRHLYPEANIPTLQLSIAIDQPGSYHYRLGEKLRPLRDQGVLIVGSGNIVHNLRRIEWDETSPPYEWAMQFDQWAKHALERRDHSSLCEEYAATEEGRLSVPSPDHYFPLLVAAGASLPEENPVFEYEGIQNGSISMRSFSYGR